MSRALRALPSKNSTMAFKPSLRTRETLLALTPSASEDV